MCPMARIVRFVGQDTLLVWLSIEPNLVGSRCFQFENVDVNNADYAALPNYLSLFSVSLHPNMDCLRLCLRQPQDTLSHQLIGPPAAAALICVTLPPVVFGFNSMLVVVALRSVRCGSCFFFAPGSGLSALRSAAAVEECLIPSRTRQP